MALFLKAKKIDISSGDLYNILLNEADAAKDGIGDADTLSIAWNDNNINVIIHLTSTDIEPGYVGIYSDIWEKFEVENDGIVDIFLPEPSQSVDIIRKKMLGKKLTEAELQTIMKDMGSRRIGEIETAYFMSTFFNPGFDEEETLWMTKAMAETGDILSFKDIKGNGDLVVDKHSIGGVAGKAVTPVLVPIIAAFDLIIPNTSTRAITSPAGTSDILEVVMPVSLNEEEITSTVKKTGACMVWGGALDLAPADDVLIHVERVIHMESYQKLMVSIVAKKISMGITHIVIDIPYGRGTKVQNPEDVEPIKKGFEKLFKKVGINAFVYTRPVFGPDGRGVGPNLEMKEVLKILERREGRSKELESLALTMAGYLLELSGKALGGKGYDMALEKLDNKEALKKFWDIAKAQGAVKVVDSEDINPGKFVKEIVSDFDGSIKFVNNKELMKISRLLGCPGIKEAGIYLHKTCSETVKKGDTLMTLYSSSQARIDSAMESLDVASIFSL